jgi:hypothetical protein
MNHRQAGLANRKDMIALLKVHPDNKWLAKWVKRVDNAEVQRKKDGCPPEFLRAWAAYGKLGSKPASLIEWNNKVEDAELVIACIPRYLAECKKNDTPIKHFQGWLHDERWERYADIKERIVASKQYTCEVCRSVTGSRHQIRRRNEGTTRVDLVWVCDECKRYDGQTI